MSKYYGLIMPTIYGTGDVRIESIEQTTTSKVSGGENIITEKLMNGRTTTFVIRNGQGLKSASQEESTDENGLRSNVVTFTSGDKDVLPDIAITVKDGVGIKSHTLTESTDADGAVIRTLTLVYTDGTSQDIAFSDTISAVKTLAESLASEKSARESGDTALQTQVAANKTAIDTLNGTGEGSVAKTVTDKIAEVVADAPEDFNTLKEISDWISGHEDDAAAMNTAIKANSDAIDAKQDKLVAGDNITISGSTISASLQATSSALIDDIAAGSKADTSSPFYKLFLMIYPVGSLYWSSKSTDPADLFGGTWSQIKDRFVLACGDTYKTAGDTGGASSVTLSVENMPSHSHTFTPSGTITMDAHSHEIGSHSHTFSGTTGGMSVNATGYAGVGDRSKNGSTRATGPFSYKYYVNGKNRQYAPSSDEDNYSLYMDISHTHSFSGTTSSTSPSCSSTTSTGKFSGTQDTTSSSGSGTSFSIMPPYIVKYCWERTA